MSDDTIMYISDLQWKVRYGNQECYSEMKLEIECAPRQNERKSGRNRKRKQTEISRGMENDRKRELIVKSDILFPSKLCRNPSVNRRDRNDHCNVNLSGMRDVDVADGYNGAHEGSKTVGQCQHGYPYICRSWPQNISITLSTIL